MKKKIIIVSILIILIIVLLIIPRDVYKKIFNRDDVSIDNPEDLVYQTMYVKNNSDFLVGIKVGVKSIEEDEIGQKWDLLTKNVNSLPTGYGSPIAATATLFEHTTEDGVLTLNVSEDFLESDGRLAIECLAWNFCNEEIKEVVVKIDEQTVKEVNNYYFNRITKDLGVNLTYETPYLFEADYVTIIYHENGTIKPVTYFYDSKNNVYDYTIQKMFKQDQTLSEMVKGSEYSYEIEDKNMVIHLEYAGSFSEELIQTITETMKINFMVDGIVINGLDTVLLEFSFLPEPTE